MNPRKRDRRLRWLVCPAVLGLVVAAGTVDAGAATKTTTKAKKTASARPADPSRPLTYSTAQPGSTFDVHKTRIAGDGAFYSVVYDKLIDVDKTGNYVPMLATAWDVKANAVTFTLRQGVRFSDGTPFDANVVKANIDRAKTLTGSTSATLLTDVTSVSVTAPDKVVFNVSKGALNLLSVLSSGGTPTPAFMMSPASFNEDLTQKAVGTGPYKLVSVGPGHASASYTANPDTWDKDGIGATNLNIIINGDGGQRLNQVKTGAAHVSYTDGALAQNAKDAGLQIRAEQVNGGYYLDFNRARGPFRKVDARRAVFYAIDRQAILDGVQFGYGQVGTQAVASGFPGYNRTIRPVYDVKRAKTLAKSSGLLDLDTPIKMVVWNIPSIAAYGEAVQGMLTELGLNVEITPVPTATINAEWDSGKYDLAMLFMGQPLQGDQTPTYNRLFGIESVANPSGPPPPEVQAMLDRTARTIDPKVQHATFADLAKVVNDRAFVLFLIKQQIPTIGSPDLLNFSSDKQAGIYLRGMVLAQQSG